jgi:hypothetical protein
VKIGFYFNNLAPVGRHGGGSEQNEYGAESFKRQCLGIVHVGARGIRFFFCKSLILRAE